MAGATVSITTTCAPEGWLVPAAFVAVAVIAYWPSARLATTDPGPPTVKLQSPSAPAVAVPRSVDPAKSDTVVLAGAVPVKVGVVSFVIASKLETPVSLAASRHGVDGAEGAGGGGTALTVHWYEAEPVLPAASVA